MKGQKEMSIFHMYAYVGTTETVLFALGVIFSLLCGCILPICGQLFGNATYSLRPSQSWESMDKDITTLSKYIFALGGIALVLQFLNYYFWCILGTRTSYKMRTQYFQCILQKDISWFDLSKPQELATKISTQCSSFQKGVGEKIGMVYSSMACGIIGITLSLLRGWQLTLFIICMAPFMFVAFSFFGKAIKKVFISQIASYSTCGGLAEEAITNIKTVASFNAQEKELKKYTDALVVSRDTSIKWLGVMGISLGAINCVVEFIIIVSFFIGSYLIQHHWHNTYTKEEYNGGDLMAVYSSGVIGLMMFSFIGTHMQQISEAKAAATAIFKVINEKTSNIQKAGNIIIPEHEFKGGIEFKDVEFVYPTQAKSQVINKISHNFRSCKTTAICGKSGNGKSTIIQLIERFYNPTKGSIFIDGYPLKDVDNTWLRKNIAYVSQEPALFNTSIKENLQYGRPNATMQEIEDVCKKANCYDFIMKLDKKFDTVVGREGSKISGGQKQRIAIARALIKKPKILLLDEATSALDKANEKLIYASLKELSSQLTIIIVAHRLSTIQNADEIIYIENGSILEIGTHDELLNKKEKYYELYNSKENDELKKEESVEEEAAPAQKDTEAEDELMKRVLENEKSKEEIKLPTVSISTVCKYNTKYLPILLIGVLIAMACGLHYPLFGYLFGRITIDVLNPDQIEMRSLVNTDFFLAIGLLLCIFVAGFLSIYIFGYVGQKVSYLYREMTYKKILSMHCGWFDKNKNSPSSLNALLFGDVATINTFIDLVLKFYIIFAVNIGAAISISTLLNWRITLLLLGIMVLSIILGSIDAKFNLGQTVQTDKWLKDSLDIISESVRNQRTIVSFNSESQVMDMYNQTLKEPYSIDKKRAIVGGITVSLSAILQIVMYGSILFFSIKYILQDSLKSAQNEADVYHIIRKFYICMYVISMSGYYIGQMQLFAPDAGKAKKGINAVYSILQTPSEIDIHNEVGIQTQLKGSIQFKQVSYKYHGRKGWVLNKFNLQIQQGSHIAIVGESGSGKSTIMQLIERFYDVNDGEILLDDMDIKKYDIKKFREQIALVSQEPALFDGTIEDNIKYANPAATQERVMEVIEISMLSELMDKFKQKGENGLAKRVGQKGITISGGEKQRIAIARALIKDPTVLLFDEATSALDKSNETQLLKNIKKVMAGKTWITIAHRLSTIENADCIFVMQKGVIFEYGKHSELMEKKGLYYNMVNGSIKCLTE